MSHMYHGCTSPSIFDESTSIYCALHHAVKCPIVLTMRVKCHWLAIFNNTLGTQHQSHQSLKKWEVHQTHLGHINFSLLDIIWILPGKINKLLLKFWPYEIIKDEIGIWHYLFLSNKSPKHNQISFWWNNLNLDKAYFHDG